MLLQSSRSDPGSFWRDAITWRSDLSFPALEAFVRRAERPLTVFDLETTHQFVRQDSFGITEVGCVHIFPDGRIGTFDRLVNPQSSMRKGAVTLTGIDREQVRFAAPFGDGVAGAFIEIAEQHFTAGFRSSGFDVEAVVSQVQRYLGRSCTFQQHFDVSWAAGLRRSSLTKSCEAMGVSLHNAHRALDDVIATARLLEAVMARAPKSVLFFPLPGRAKAFEQYKNQLTDAYLRATDHLSDLSLGTAVGERPDRAAFRAAQRLLAQPELASRLLDEDRLAETERLLLQAEEQNPTSVKPEIFATVGRTELAPSLVELELVWARKEYGNRNSVDEVATKAEEEPMREALKQDALGAMEDETAAPSGDAGFGTAVESSAPLKNDEDAKSVIDQLVGLREERRQLDDQIDQLESRLRDFARAEAKERLSGSEFSVKISPTVSTSLPSSGSKEREELEAQIRDLNIWDKCSTLNAARIKKVAEDETISEAERVLLKQRLTFKNSSRMTFSRLKK
jgi:DNA polymerase III epsilon subunit-like protein